MSGSIPKKRKPSRGIESKSAALTRAISASGRNASAAALDLLADDVLRFGESRHLVRRSASGAAGAEFTGWRE
jgi:hypothetical protein